jgi:hypothetical protein
MLCGGLAILSLFMLASELSRRGNLNDISALPFGRSGIANVSIGLALTYLVVLLLCRGMSA